MPRWSQFAPYVSAAERRTRAASDLARLRKQARKKGRAPAPVEIAGRTIAATFWGKAWCDNLESYADFAYRLDRGRSYVRAGAVIDLHIAPGAIEARVSGTELYEVSVGLTKLRAASWRALAARCGRGVASLVGLLEGKLPDEVMRAVTDRKQGLFPEPRQLRLDCTCPDAANVCKHVAATLYGVGHRLDARPELLFQLRGVDPQELVQQATDDLVTAAPAAPASTLATDDLAALFGIDLVTEVPPAPPARRSRRR